MSDENLLDVNQELEVSSELNDDANDSDEAIEAPEHCGGCCYYSDAPGMDSGHCTNPDKAGGVVREDTAACELGVME